jgi:hypothetical protein
MQKGEKIAGIIIFIMTIPYGLYALSQLAAMLEVTIRPIYNTRTTYIYSLLSFGLWVFMSYFSVFLIGIFVLPFFRKHRLLLTIPLGIFALSLTWLSAPTIISFFSKTGLYTRLDTVQTINSMRFPVTSIASVLLITCIFLYFTIKKIRAFLPAIALFISFVVHFAYSIVYFTSWYWSLFPEDVIKEVGLTLMFSYFLIFETIYFHLIFLLLLIFVKPYYKNKEKQQLVPSETEATA